MNDEFYVVLDYFIGLLLMFAIAFMLVWSWSLT